MRKNEHEELEEAPTNKSNADAEPNNSTDPETMSNTTDKQYGARTRTNIRDRGKKSPSPEVTHTPDNQQ